MQPLFTTYAPPLLNLATYAFYPHGQLFIKSSATQTYAKLSHANAMACLFKFGLQKSFA
jgi:hypothetical protein